MKIHILFFELFVCLIPFTSSAQVHDNSSDEVGSQLIEMHYSKLDSIIDNAKNYIDIKYLYGGSSESGFDCSGFIFYVFNQFNVSLSRSSSRLSKMGEIIDLKNIREGDLLFFKGRDLNSENVGHVSLVVEKKQSSFKMIHATRRGVVVDFYDDMTYYQKRFLFAKRIIVFDETCDL